MEHSARSSVKILVDIGTKSTKGSFASLKKVWTSRQGAWRVGIKAAFWSLLVSTRLYPLGGLNFSVLLKKQPFNMPSNTVIENDDGIQSRDASWGEWIPESSSGGPTSPLSKGIY
jgi:hypothetical protein